MPRFDLPLDELRRHRTESRPPADLADFWAHTLEHARRRAWPAQARPVDIGLTVVDTFDVSFSGYGGERVKAWLHVPSGGGRGAAVVRYVGYNCGRGLPHVVPHLALAGYTVLSMDNRGQGAIAGYPGDTPDEGGLRQLGLAARGLESRGQYYYRRLFTDAVLAVDTVRRLPSVDAERVAVAGVSQGGGIALAVAGLAQGLRAALIDLPFLSDIPRALEIAAETPYTEIAGVLAGYPDRADAMLDALSYFDGTSLAPTATAPALFSVALMDPVCPPSTVYAAYNAYAGAKEIREYPYNGHEGGSFLQEAEQLAWLPAHLPL